MIKKLSSKLKGILAAAIIFGLLIGSYAFLNIETSTQQGIDGKVSSIKMPLYMKITDFWVRSNRYKLLVESIVKDSKTDMEKILALFEWTSINIRPVPKGFPLFDDHVDNIIIRGYGSSDQSADVFTTLLVLMEFKAAMYVIKLHPERVAHVVSLVEYNNRLMLFDTYNHFYFYNKNGQIASLEEIRENIEIVKSVADDYKIWGFDYFRFYQNMKPVEKIKGSKADLQFPLKRVKYFIERLLKFQKPYPSFYGDSFS